MDRNFARALQLVLKSEGGYSNNAADPGGPTNLGITLANFRAFINPQGTVDDLKHLTIEQAGICYKKQYWDAVSGDRLPDGVDYAVMDFGVNSGPGRAARYLQSVVGAPLDGVIGPATLDAVAKMPAGVVIDHLCDMRLQFLQRLPTWPTFGHGWSDRVESVRKNALLMTAQSSQPSPAPAQPPQQAPAPVPVPQPTKVETPPSKPPVAAVKPSAKPAAAAGLFVILATVLATYRHELIAWFLHLLP